jgi:ribose transport system permease protein
VRKTAAFLQEYGVLIAFAVLFIVNVATRGVSFLQFENIRNLFSQSAYVGIIAVGMTLVIISAGIDLSVGSLVALCGAFCVLTLNKFAGTGDSMAILMAFGASVAVGTVMGLLNGAMIAYGRVAPFVVTLAGLAGFRSLALVLGNGGEIRSNVAATDAIGFGGINIPGARLATGGPVTFYWSAVAFLLVAVFFGFVLNRTRFGRRVIAVGANEKAAKYSAINTERIKLAVYTITGGLCGLTAFFNVARQNSVATGAVGNFFELDAIAAVVIGGTSLSGGKGRIWGTVVGIVLMTLISNMMTAYRVNTNWQGFVSGLVILVAVLLQRGSKANG